MRTHYDRGKTLLHLLARSYCCSFSLRFSDGNLRRCLVFSCFPLLYGRLFVLTLALLVVHVSLVIHNSSVVSSAEWRSTALILRANSRRVSLELTECRLLRHLSTKNPEAAPVRNAATAKGSGDDCGDVHCVRRHKSLFEFCKFRSGF